MKDQGTGLLLTTSPFLKHHDDTAALMRQVIYSLIPAVLAACYFFGATVLLVASVCVAGALLPEWLASRSSGVAGTLMDGSALITGLLLALTLPPTVPLWIAFLGGVVATVVGKLIFGGIGNNIFNPALVGRAFLQAAFPVAMTTWSVPSPVGQFLSIRASTFAPPLLRTDVDAVSAATPLAKMKFDNEVTEVSDLLLGNTAGSIGETSAVIILICGLYLGFRRVLNWRIPLSIFGTVAAVSTLLWLIDSGSYAPPAFHLFSGGLMLGALYMATDPVTSPVTQRGCWLFGIGVGVLVVVIRTFGGLPEGVMYAILIMNAATPLINRVTQPRTYGA